MHILSTHACLFLYVLCVIMLSGGLHEPPVVPRFIAGLQQLGATAHRVPAYQTTLGLSGPEAARTEWQLLQSGYYDAIAFSSTAEVSAVCLHVFAGKQGWLHDSAQHAEVVLPSGSHKTR